MCGDPHRHNIPKGLGNVTLELRSRSGVWRYKRRKGSSQEDERKCLENKRALFMEMRFCLGKDDDSVNSSLPCISRQLRDRKRASPESPRSWVLLTQNSVHVNVYLRATSPWGSLSLVSTLALIMFQKYLLEYPIVHIMSLWQICY